MHRRLTCILAALVIAGTAMAQTQTRPAEEPTVEKKPATTAILHTSLGDITLGFYPELAPAHVENFLDLPPVASTTAPRSTA